MDKLLVKCMRGTQLTTTPENAGIVMVCPQCQQQFRVPDGDRSPQAIPAQPTSMNLGALDIPPQSGPATRPTSRSRASGRRPTAVQTTTFVPAYRAPANPAISDKTIRLAIGASIAAIVLMFMSVIAWMVVDRVAQAIKERPVAESKAETQDSLASAESSQTLGDDRDMRSQTPGLVSDPSDSRLPSSPNSFANHPSSSSGASVSQVSDSQFARSGQIVAGHLSFRLPNGPPPRIAGH